LIGYIRGVTTLAPLTGLAQALSLELARRDAPPAARDALRDLVDTLRSAVARGRFSATSLHDYSATLDSAIASCNADETAATCRDLLNVRSLLPWTYHYAARAGEETLATQIAFAELIGPDGPMSAPHSRVGFTLIAPNTSYPMHAHPAVELYWVMSGHALWETPTTKHIVPPGEFVLHRSNEAHAMRTFDGPLLALWGWSGDVDTPAFYL
jgi:mannose-6-phosphate isomerase-like protein (cupin superfamily)